MLRSLLALLALACLTSAYKRSWSVSPGSKEFLVPGTLFFHDHSSYTFGKCEATSESERVCNVTLVTQPTQKEQHCPKVRVFASEGRKLFLDGYFQLWPYSRTRVIVGWWEQSKDGSSEKKKSFWNLGILNMEDCSTSYLSFPIDNAAYGFFPSQLLYPNELDVIINSKETCKTDEKCKITYNLVGKQVGEIQPYKPNKSGYASPVSNLDPKKGFFMAVQELNDLTVLLVDSKGEGNTLMKDQFEDGVTKQRVAFSNAHELYSICRLPVVPDNKPTKIHCSQFDSKGAIVFKREVTVPQTVSWIAVRSLPKGGLILTASACDDSQIGENCQGFNIYKVNRAGKQSKPMTIPDFDLKCNEAPESRPDHTELGTHIYETPDNEYCFDFACLQSNTLDFTHKCVSRKSIENIKV